MKRTGFLRRCTPMRKKRRGTFKHKAWDAFSVYVRTGNADENGMVRCISCPAIKHWKEIHAGHYIAKSLSLFLRFHEKNVHPQCAGCNTFKHGNLAQYALALKRKYGDGILEELDQLRRDNEGHKISEFGYEQIFEKYKEAP